MHYWLGALPYSYVWSCDFVMNQECRLLRLLTGVSQVCELYLYYYTTPTITSNITVTATTTTATALLLLQ